MKPSIPAALAAGCLMSAAVFAQDPLPPYGPDPIDLSSDIVVRAELEGNMPFVVAPGLIKGTLVQNIGSPVAIKNDLYFIDQNDAILRLKPGGKKGSAEMETVFSIQRGDGPDGLVLANRQAVMNISAGPDRNSLYVMLTANKESVLPLVPRQVMPTALTELCCFDSRELPDLYNVVEADMAGTPFDFFVFAGREHQILYEAELENGQVASMRPILILDAGAGPGHHGGGMLTLPDGRILYVTGDGLPFGTSGRESAQDPNSHLSKMLLIDPADGSFEVAAMGLRNVQHLEFSQTKGMKKEDYVGFADIGGWTAEEINFVRLADLLDTSVLENFGWGTNADGNAREGTFYVGRGQAFTTGTPPVEFPAPSPEAGFIQPHAQYERPANGDLNGGLAATGPVTSRRSLHKLTALFSDLDSGNLYGTTGGYEDIASTGYKLGIVDKQGNAFSSLEELAGLPRVDPRFFRFPDGSAGVLFEANGNFYRLTEVRTK